MSRIVGGGEDTLAMISYPPHPVLYSGALKKAVMLRNYTSFFSDTELDFLRFHEHKNGGGGGGGGAGGARHPGQGVFTPTLYFLTCHAVCYVD